MPPSPSDPNALDQPPFAPRRQSTPAALSPSSEPFATSLRLLSASSKQQTNTFPLASPGADIIAICIDLWVCSLVGCCGERGAAY